MSETTARIKAELIRRLGDFEWRHWFAGVVMRRFLAYQIRQCRLSRGWTRRELAKRAGVDLTTVVRYETYAGPSISVLKRFAAAFDCALVCRFTSWGEFLEHAMRKDDGNVPSFVDDARLLDMR